MWFLMTHSCTHVCARTDRHTRTHAHTHSLRHRHTQTHTHRHTQTQTQTQVHSHSNMHAQRCMAALTSAVLAEVARLRSVYSQTFSGEKDAGAAVANAFFQIDTAVSDWDELVDQAEAFVLSLLCADACVNVCVCVHVRACVIALLRRTHHCHHLRCPPPNPSLPPTLRCPPNPSLSAVLQSRAIESMGGGRRRCNRWSLLRIRL